jgi:hypothetical protein
MMRKKGKVLADRCHAHVLRTPTEVRREESVAHKLTAPGPLGALSTIRIVKKKAAGESVSE